MLGEDPLKGVFVQVNAVSPVKHQIYEDTNQVQRIVMARNLP
ncbi:hypothetical protein [Streptomyces tibetensis]